MNSKLQWLVILAVGLAGLAFGPVEGAFAQMRLPPAPNSSPPPPQQPIPQTNADAYRDTYILGVGDRLRVIVYGEPDLSGEFEIDANGGISLPLVGLITARGRTIHGLEQFITEKYNEYLRNPRVNLQVIQYRPFFILGEVRQPGSYAFIPGMTAKNAIAVAGGYTVRGGPDEISIEHAGSKGKEVPCTEDTPVYPGDVIRVSGRLF
jgi:polysaccharide export outer membrane protein